MGDDSQLGVSKEYDRELFDDTTARSKYKNETFNGAGTIKDSVTGEMIHKSHVAAKRKYQQGSESKAWVKHASETDHIISLEQGHEILSQNPFLTDEDVAYILNQKSNFRETAKSFNSSKQGKTDLAMILDDAVPIEGKVELIRSNVSAVGHITKDTLIISGRKGCNKFVSGANDALNRSAELLLATSAKEMIEVLKGEKTLTDAAQDTGKTVIAAAASEGASRVASVALKNVSNKAVSSLVKNVNVGTIVQVSYVMLASIGDYVNGNISEEEVVEQVKERGVDALGAMIGSCVGQILIPIPYVGAMIGSMIVSTVCGEVYRTYKKLADSSYASEAAKINSVAEAALREMQTHREHLRALVINEYEGWDKVFDESYQVILEATFNDDVEGIAKGLENILSVFDGQIQFKTEEEFNEFFDDPNAIFVL